MGSWFCHDCGCRRSHGRGLVNLCYFCAHTPSSSTAAISSVESIGNNEIQRNGDGFCSFVSDIFKKLITAVLACIFASVGSLIGAFTGALLGRATETGFFRGAGIGAISGAVFTIEVFESSLSSWPFDESGVWNIVCKTDLIPSLLNGRLVREQVGPAMLSAVESQMSAIDTAFEEVHDIFETGGAKGMPGDLVEQLPKIKITAENNADALGERLCCAICLQDFREGETARSLSLCQHMFHMPCVDSWLIRNSSCPLCRRDL